MKSYFIKKLKMLAYLIADLFLVFIVMKITGKDEWSLGIACLALITAREVYVEINEKKNDITAELIIKNVTKEEAEEIEQKIYATCKDNNVKVKKL